MHCRLTKKLFGYLLYEMAHKISSRFRSQPSNLANQDFVPNRLAIVISHETNAGGDGPFDHIHTKPFKPAFTEAFFSIKDKITV